MSLLHHDVQREAFALASCFRGNFYACLRTRRDEVLELTDALLCADGPMTTPGALYTALNHGRVDVAGLRRTSAALPQPRAADDGLVLAVDVSNWLRPDAPCSPERLFCHTYGRGRGPAPDGPRLALLVRRRTGDWTDLVVPAAGSGPARPTDDVAEVTARQVRRVVGDLVIGRQWKDGDPGCVVGPVRAGARGCVPGRPGTAGSRHAAQP
ncbi:transposase [Streptomyces sp. NPDC059479]|uniref:transposase n=1 Tax=Streptomyces sp. NPDC059479 TaxID=3346848 RepID=UPI00367F2D12